MSVLVGKYSNGKRRSSPTKLKAWSVTLSGTQKDGRNVNRRIFEYFYIKLLDKLLSFIEALHIETIGKAPLFSCEYLRRMRNGYNFENSNRMSITPTQLWLRYKGRKLERQEQTVTTRTTNFPAKYIALFCMSCTVSFHVFLFDGLIKTYRMLFKTVQTRARGMEWQIWYLLDFLTSCELWPVRPILTVFSFAADVHPLLPLSDLRTASSLTIR